jgi:hypothetical protein
LLVGFIAACSSADETPAPAVALEAGAGETPDAGGPGDAPDGDAASDGATSPQPVVLFDGTLGSDWKMTTIKNQPGRDDPGHVTVDDGAIVVHPGTDLGLLWNTRPTPADFLLELEFRLAAQDDNSGVFVRFPDPESKGYDNTAWVAVDFGFEVQIDETGAPDGSFLHTTGAIYAQQDQTFTRVVAKPPGEWNAYAIRVEGQVYTVTLNGQQVTRFENRDAKRGLASAAGAPAFIGLQTHSGTPAFRNIRIRELR